MMMEINSYNDLFSRFAGNERVYLLLYKSDSDQSRCALRDLDNASKELKSDSVYTADVNTVKDIHQRYGIDSVPTLLVFKNGKHESTIKGCHDSQYYKTLLENSTYQAASSQNKKAEKRVTVYSTPTCSWCNTLKSWLRKNNINYRDVDISRDQKAADTLVRRSGQQGVPQTDINGRIVVGFNQPLLKELLEIQ
jgi:glutaredoxin-like YruB-family protein